MTAEELEKMIAAAKKQKAAKAKRAYSLSINRNEGLYIQYRMRVAGRTCADVARDIGCARAAVARVVNGEAHSKKLEAEIAHTLRYASWNAMVQDIRAQKLAEVVA